MRRIFIIILALSSIIVSYGQHIPVTSSYMYNGLYINPAYAGSRDALSLDVFGRKQWVGVDGAPTTAMLSAHLPLKNENIGLGILPLDRCAGETNHSNAKR